jgi:hypothetical protein
MEMLEARLADSPVRALIVDLDVAETALAMIARVKGIGHRASGNGEERSAGASASSDAQCPMPDASPRVLAFGPHVAKDTLQAARDAGADDVLTRGAFDHHMDQVLVKLAAGGRA